jgi:hypothetical protein
MRVCEQPRVHEIIVLILCSVMLYYLSRQTSSRGLRYQRRVARLEELEERERNIKELRAITEAQLQVVQLFL